MFQESHEFQLRYKLNRAEQPRRLTTSFYTLLGAARKLMPSANCLAIAVGVACLMYGTMGIFGAARFGQATEGDCLVNTWLGGRRERWIDLFMALYLSISIPPMQVNTCTLLLSTHSSIA